MRKIEAKGAGSDDDAGVSASHRDTTILVPVSARLKRDFSAKAKARGFSVAAVIRALMAGWAGRPPDELGEDYISDADIRREMESAPKRTKSPGRPRKKRPPTAP